MSARYNFRTLGSRRLRSVSRIFSAYGGTKSDGWSLDPTPKALFSNERRDVASDKSHRMMQHDKTSGINSNHASNCAINRRGVNSSSARVTGSVAPLFKEVMSA